MGNQHFGHQQWSAYHWHYEGRYAALHDLRWSWFSHLQTSHPASSRRYVNEPGTRLSHKSNMNYHKTSICTHWVMFSNPPPLRLPKTNGHVRNTVANRNISTQNVSSQVKTTKSWECRRIWPTRSQDRKNNFFRHQTRKKSDSLSLLNRNAHVMSFTLRR